MDPAAQANSEEDPGRHGHWPQSTINSNTMDQSTPETPTSETASETAPVHGRRGRGRPRVLTARDASAIEKRRAQVRNAQRTYQKRKDGAAASKNQRSDDLLQILSDLSTEVEALLRAASKAGILGQDDEPELRLLQTKNDRRQAEHKANENFRIGNATANDEPQMEPPSSANAAEFDPSNVDLELVRVDGTTLAQSFTHMATPSKVMAGRSIFDIVAERQAAFRNTERPPS